MPTTWSRLPSYTGTRWCRFARIAGRSRSGGVVTSIPKTSVRGTMISATVVSPSSKTPWIISRSLRWTTPSWWPTSTRVRSSASVMAAALVTPPPSAARETKWVKAPSRRRTGVRSHWSASTGRATSRPNRCGMPTAIVIGRTSPKTTMRKTITGIASPIPRGPSRDVATCVASAEAAMFTRVMPTSSVIRRSRGSRRTRASRACPGDSSGSRCALPRRESEKKAASAPARSAETPRRAVRRMKSRTSRSIELQPKWSKPGWTACGRPARSTNRTPSSRGRTSPIRWTGVPVRSVTARARSVARSGVAVKRSS